MTPADRQRLFRDALALVEGNLACDPSNGALRSRAAALRRKILPVDMFGIVWGVSYEPD